MASKDDYRHLRVVDAFASLNQRVSLVGIIVDRTLPKRSKGTDYCCSVRIVDASHHSRGLLVNFYAQSMNKLPQVECEGDIILLSHVMIKAYNKEIVALFNKRSSAFALYEGKYGQSFIPYQCYSNFHTREQDKEFVAELRKWMDSVQLDTVSKVSTLLREIRKGEKLDLVCKILHRCEVNEDEVMLFVWDGTDAPRCNIQEKLDHEKENPLPLQLEGERLSRDVLSKFPTVGTVLRVKVERRGNLDPSSLSVGRWVKLINLAFDVHAGLWYGIFSPWTRIRYVPDEDRIILKCLRSVRYPFFLHFSCTCFRIAFAESMYNQVKFTKNVYKQVVKIEARLIIGPMSPSPSYYTIYLLEPKSSIVLLNIVGHPHPCLTTFCFISDFEERFSSQWDRMPFTCFPWPPLVTETEKQDVALVTLMDIINYSQVTAKFRCIVRVVSMLPSNPKDFCSPKGTYRIRLTLEDPTARIHAYLFGEDAEFFFGGYPGMDELSRKRKEFLGIPGCNEAEDAPRNPPWILCGIKSYYLDKTNMWESRTYAVFMTKLIC